MKRRRAITDNGSLMERRWGLVGLALTAVAVSAPAVAQAPPMPDRPFVLLASNVRIGHIDVVAYGPPGTSVGAGELVDGQVRPLGSFSIAPEGYGELKRAAVWSCERRNRRIVGIARLPDAQAASSEFAVRTPSCRYRFELSLPGRSAPGRRVAVGVRDRWGLGGETGRLCLRGPAGPQRCRDLVVPRRRPTVRTSIRPSRPGRWEVRFSGPGWRLRRVLLVGDRGRRERPVAPPTILVTGDSMVQSIDAVLGDRLANGARVVTHSLPAHGVSNPGFDWPAYSRRDARRTRPAVTVVFVGAAEGFDMETPGGARFSCCVDGWVAEYTRRVRGMMRAYGRSGPVVWLALPAPRDPDLRRVHDAVNRALREAALESHGVRFLRLDSVLTPGFAYRDAMRYRGRRVRVRAEDGVHLTVAGATIAADLVLRVPALRRLRGTGSAGTPGRRGR